MITRSEAPFTINGIKSSIHVWHQRSVRTNRTVPNAYHYHDYMEILYATDSDTVLWVNGESHPFRSGDVAVINSGEPHAFTFNESSNYICLKFTPGIFSADNGCMFQIQYLLPSLGKDLSKRVFPSSELEGIDIEALVNEITLEWDGKETAHELIIRANIFKIFAAIIRLWEKNNVFKFAPRPSDAMQKALTYISEKNACVSEEEVASICSLSPNYFSRSFKNTVGKNFKDYINSIKLQNARNLLVATTKNITEIAYDTGFSSTSHFISAFKKEFHLTPKQFQIRIKTKSTPFT